MPEIVLAGHPYAPIGRGEDLRCSFRATRSVALRTRLLDIYGFPGADPALVGEFGPHLSTEFGRINIFHINGDEVEPILSHLGERWPSDGYNIVYPAWELANYPKTWADALDRFDEIWAPSRFIQDALLPKASKPVIHVPLACEVILDSFLGRRYFGIPESPYVFLFFFDFRSYLDRKNPYAVLTAFERVLRERPTAEIHLVIKFNGAETRPMEAAALRARLQQHRDRISLIDRTLSDNETKNLIRCCDCFVSLHRAEGFGRGIAEAMYLEKPVIATAYSGNMDFTSPETALPVGFQLKRVARDAYPHWQGQVWAEPDIEEATRHMMTLIDQPQFGRDLGRRARTNLRVHFSYRAVGNAIRERLGAIGELLRSGESHAGAHPSGGSAKAARRPRKAAQAG